MVKGMWTKQYAADGKAFYFNAAQNRSVWQPPPDSIVHEAPELYQPTEEDYNRTENEKAMLAFTQQSISVETDPTHEDADTALQLGQIHHPENFDSAPDR